MTYTYQDIGSVYIVQAAFTPIFVSVGLVAFYLKHKELPWTLYPECVDSIQILDGPDDLIMTLYLRDRNVNSEKRRVLIFYLVNA